MAGKRNAGESVDGQPGETAEIGRLPDEVKDLLTSLPGDTLVMLYRRAARTREWEYVTDYAVEEFDVPIVKKEWGGGKYLMKPYYTNQKTGKRAFGPQRQFSIAGEPKTAESNDAGDEKDKPSKGIKTREQIIDMGLMGMFDQMQRNVARENERAQQHTLMMSKMINGSGEKENQPNPIVMKMLELFAPVVVGIVLERMKPQETASLAEQLDEFMKVKEALGGDKEPTETGWLGLARETVTAVKEIATKGRPGNRPPKVKTGTPPGEPITAEEDEPVSWRTSVKPLIGRLGQVTWMQHQTAADLFLQKLDEVGFADLVQDVQQPEFVARTMADFGLSVPSVDGSAEWVKAVLEELPAAIEAATAEEEPDAEPEPPKGKAS